MNTNKASAVALATAVAKGTPASGVQVGIAVPFVYLDAVNQAIAGTPLLLGAQDAYFEKDGALAQQTFVRSRPRLPSSSKSLPSIRTRPSIDLPDGENASSVSSGVSFETP